MPNVYKGIMNKKQENNVRIFGTVASLTVAAMLTAMSVVIGIFCKSVLNFGGGLFRVTLENLPILMAGIMFGPIVGGVVGAATDIISYFLSGQAYPLNLIVTVGAMSIGAVSGFFAKYVWRKNGYARIILSSPDYDKLEYIGEVDIEEFRTDFDGTVERSEIYKILHSAKDYKTALEEIYAILPGEKITIEGTAQIMRIRAK